MVANRLPSPAQRLRGAGRLPSPKNLIRQTPQQLIRTLGRFGISPNMKEIQQRAERAYQRLGKIIEAGIEPDEAMWKSLEEQNRREMEQSLRQMAKSSIRNYRHEVARNSGNAYFVWLTSGGANVCPSCEPRHGKVKTWTQWERMGLPGSAGLLCGAECNCQLLPAP